MNRKHLLEAASLVGESASEDGTWKVRLISEGKGSSGVYTASLLEAHHHAFDNVLSFKNHPVGWEGPQERDFTMIAGKVVGETWVGEDERGLKAVYANYLPDPEYKDKLERYRDQLGLSIYIEGSGYVDESTGDFIVDWLNPEDPFASVDVVIAPGARGRFLESMKKTYGSMHESKEAEATAAKEGKDNDMEIEKVVEAVEALTAQVSALVADKKNAEAAEAQAKADAEAIAEAVASFEAAVKAVEEADLLAPQKADILEAAKSGADVGPLIEQAVKIKEAAVEAVSNATEVTEGRVLGGDSKGFSLTEIAEAR